MSQLQVNFRLIGTERYVSTKVTDNIEGALLNKSELEELKVDVLQILEDINFFLEKIK